MRTLLIALLAGLLVSGCGADSASPRPTASTSTSPSPTASATPTPPAMPAAAKAKTKAGAEAFVRHYLDLVSTALTSLDTRALRRAYQSTCGKCEGLAKGIDQVRQDGGLITGNQQTPRRFAHIGWRQNLYYLDAYVDVDTGSMRRAQGAPLKRSAPVKDRLAAFVLIYESGTWKVADLDREAS